MIVAQNRYLKKIATIAKEENPSRAMERFIEERRAVGESLESLAQRLGVGSIVEERLPFEGGVFRRGGGGFEIKLNVSSSFARKRFTLAHEIGHLLLGDASGRRMACKSDPALERACDCIAAELLMPRAEAIPFVTELGPPTPDKLKTIAHRFGVSLHVAAIRVHDDFRLWKCFAGLWKQNGGVQTIWFVGKRLWDSTVLDLYSLDLALESLSSVRTTELWRRGNYSDTVWLDLLHVGSNRVLGLVSH